MSKGREHIPVLLKEVLAEFEPKKGKKFIDATVGFGGHTEKLLKEGSKVLGIDWDPEVVNKVKKRLSSQVRLEDYCPEASYQIVNANFRQLAKIAKQNDFYPVEGVLFDLGVSRWHYKKAERGFSFEDEKLDMRISPEIDQTASKIINSYSFQSLYELFTKLVQEKLAEPIAKAVVSARREEKFNSGVRLANLVEQVYKEHNEKTSFHPATKIFLALRIEVNRELENLEEGLKQSLEVCKTNGKILVITFHSGEDRLVKLFGRRQKQMGKIRTNLIFPSESEVKKNPLARSAKLRVLERIS